MKPQSWWLALPLVVVLLGVGYAVGEAWANPFDSSPVAGTTAFTADVGVTRFMDVQIRPDRAKLSPHISSVRAVGGGPGLVVSFATTTYDQIGQSSSGFPLRCAQGVNRSVAGTPLSRSTDTVLRLIFAPSRPGTYQLKGFELAWQAGVFHGSDFSPLAITIHATANPTDDGCI
jgi:hypothetical protein